jgi:hypothetical protein
MRAARIDRMKLTDAHSAQITCEDVPASSRELNKYGASAICAAVIKSGAPPDRTLYVVNLILPSDAAAAILPGFNLDDKIAEASIVSIAGDCILLSRGCVRRPPRHRAWLMTISAAALAELEESAR